MHRTPSMPAIRPPPPPPALQNYSRTLPIAFFVTLSPTSFSFYYYYYYYYCCCYYTTSTTTTMCYYYYYYYYSLLRWGALSGLPSQNLPADTQTGPQIGAIPGVHHPFLG